MRNKPGAEKAYINDLNKDGKEDIIALFGQGDEGIFIYYNEGHGKYREETALSFSASNGSSFFKLYDFNKDGFDDIIYTAGDNADFKPILKPYHGIYVYLNDGQNNFKQEIFYQLNGAYAAMPADYDLDGDIDLFVGVRSIPIYYGLPANGFILQNDRKGNYSDVTSKIIPSLKNIGMITDAVWIDYDSDKDVDLLVVGEYMPLRIFQNNGGKFTETSANAGFENTNGWWNTVE